MDPYSASPDPIPVVRLVRPPIPDDAKMMLTPLDIGLQTVESYLAPEALARVRSEFGAYLGKPQHPVLVSNAFSDVVCRAAFPTLALPEARRYLGRLSVSQYQQSILGRVMFAPLRIIGMERTLRQAPRQFAATTNYGTRWVASLGSHHWRFDCEDEVMHPESMLGHFEAVAAFIGVQNFSIRFTRRAPRHYSYDITWNGT
jgi:uncharacterized protein (TIGR02265 family)